MDCVGPMPALHRGQGDSGSSDTASNDINALRLDSVWSSTSLTSPVDLVSFIPQQRHRISGKLGEPTGSAADSWYIQLRHIRGSSF